MVVQKNMLMIIVSVAYVYASFGLQLVTTQQRLVRDILNDYDARIKPTRLANGSVKVKFRLDLYQIIEVNEPQQSITLNAWVSESWDDELLYWDPEEYENVTEINLPHTEVWKPDTILYNSLVMKDEEARRLLNVKLTTDTTKKSVNIDMLYPTKFTFSCILFLLDFPFDQQNCSLTFGSWTYDSGSVDYFPYAVNVGLSNFLANEGWKVTSFIGKRISLKYSCCPLPWTNLKYNLNIKRKPLFYIVNLVIPTLIITLISIIGFFMPSTATGERHEKVSLGITTLLSMSILLLMVSHEMPTTSSFIPLIGWFYLCMIILISLGTIMSSIVIVIQKKGQFGERISRKKVWVLRLMSTLLFVPLPNHLETQREGSTTDKFSDAKGENILDWGSVNWILSGRRKKSKSNICAKDKMNESGIQLIQNKKNGKPEEQENNNNKMIKDSRKRRAFDGKNRPNNTETAKSEKEERVYAAREYEWYATVVERVCFVFFLSILGGIVLYTSYRSLVHKYAG